MDRAHAHAARQILGFSSRKYGHTEKVAYGNKYSLIYPFNDTLFAVSV